MVKKICLAGKTRISILHFICTGIFFGIFAIVLHLFWYPSPYWQLAGVGDFFVCFFSVGLICGPVLAGVLYDPKKIRREKIFDAIFIIIIQLSVLAFGVFALAKNRPLALVFEVDRFRVISLPDVYEVELDKMSKAMSPWGFTRPKLLGIKASSTAGELLESIDLSMSGIEPSQRPSRWQSYEINAAGAVARAQSIADYKFLQNWMYKKFNAEIACKGLNSKNLRWMPVQGQYGGNWNLLIDSHNGMPVAFFSATGDVVLWLN